MNLTKTITCISLLFIGIVLAANKNDTRTIMKGLDSLPLDRGEQSFLVEDGEVAINGNLIKRVAIGRDKITISYRNKGQKAKQPQYTIRLYNRYGFLLAEKTFPKMLFGGVYVKPGDVATEDWRVRWMPLDRIIKKTGNVLPKDWRTAAWVVISDIKD